MYHHILVAFDGSPHAEQALADAIDLARTQNSKLTILTAVPHPPVTASLAGAAAVPLAGELQAEFAAIARRATNTVPHDISVTGILTETPVRDALIEQLETGEFDLVVMGSRGRGAVRSTLLGSVSHYLLNHSTVPLLIVHSKAGSPRSSPAGRSETRVTRRSPLTAAVK